MKAEELMIDDWVISRKRGKDEILQVVTTDGGSNTVWLDGDSYSGLAKGDDIFPIPLTAEILEKNGFKKDVRDENYYKWNWYILEDNASYDMKTGKVRIFKVSDLTFCHPIGYVHELQHALRLCEVEKEIIL